LDALKYFALALSGKVALTLRKKMVRSHPKNNALTLRSRFFLKLFYRKTIFPILRNVSPLREIVYVKTKNILWVKIDKFCDLKLRYRNF
jgi:hypothetical protein